MLAPARLILVRHGETVWNIEQRMQGHQDSPLTPRGLSQARELARRVGALAPAQLYASDLGRTLATARPIAEACGVSLIEDAELRERHLGIFEGLTLAEIERLHPEVWQCFRTDGPDYVVPGGESARQRFERTLRALTRIALRHPGQSTAIVAHAGTLDSAFRAATGIPLEERPGFSRAHGSLHVIEYRAERWQLITWGDTAYLGDP